MCGKLVDHDCWDCVIAEEDGRGRCNSHHPLAGQVDMGVGVLRESMGVDGESEIPGEPDSTTEVPDLWPAAQ